MDKMREEFEAFMANPHWSWATGDMKEELYCLWQASRAALCVELPENCKGMALTVSELHRQLDRAGVSYK